MPWIGPEAAIMGTVTMGTATDPAMNATSRASMPCTAIFGRSCRGTAACRGTGIEETGTGIGIEIEGTGIGAGIETETGTTTGKR